MAITTTLRTLIDGPRSAVVMLYLKGDGATGDVTDVVMIDPVNLQHPEAQHGNTALKMLAVPGLTVEEMWTECVNMTLTLNFKATTNTPVWKVSTGQDTYKSFKLFGGIKDNSGAGATGQVVYTTTGIATAGAEATVIVKVKKD